MHRPERILPTVTRIEAGSVAAFLDAVPPHEVRLIAGLDAATLADLLTDAPSTRRPVLRLDLAGPGNAAACIERAIQALSDAVGRLWPYLWGGEDFSQVRDDPLSRAHLPLRLAALSARQAGVSRAWAQEIVPQLQRGATPRLATPSPPVEWSQLAQAFAPTGLVIVVPLGPDADAFVAAVEWLARNADVAVLVLAETMPASPAYERILYGAREVAHASALPRTGPESPRADPPLVIALPETEGRPHPQSDVELRLYTLIQADADLRPLFAFNRFVADLPLLQAKPDLIWADGRLVVEIDGPEHRGAAKYRADRHRDFELVRAGYRVLRMTNEDILTDAALALEKIRDLVRLTQRESR